MIKVGITGGIGSGKTTVCRIFEVLEVPIYYADSRAKYLMSHDKKLKASIKDLLGAEAYHINGRLNRKFVASQIFSNKELLQGINSLVHPAVAHDYDRWVNQYNDHPYTIKEAALLIEAGSYKDLDILIVVTAAEEVRVARVVQRDKTTVKAVVQRMNNQMNESEKIDLANYVVDNSGKVSLIAQVIDIHHALLQKNKVARSGHHHWNKK